MAIVETVEQMSVEADQHAEGSYMDWPAIFAGTVLASAISFVLLTFGSAIGLSLTSAYEGRGISLIGFAIAAALWLLWVQISSFIAGGYLTGRMRRRHFDATEHESDIRDGSHGLIVWALGVLVGAFLALSGISAAVATATNAASTVAAGAAAGAADDVLDANSLLMDRFLRSDTTADPAPAATRDEIGRVIASSLGTGTLEDPDRQFLARTVAARTGIDEAQATQRVDEMWQQAQAAEAETRRAAERARKIGMVAAFITAASLLVSAVGAYFGATLGGNHRDNQTVFHDWVKPWRRETS